MRKLAILTHFESVHPPTHGAARRIWGLARHLHAFGFDVSILTHSTGRLSQRSVEGVRIIQTPLPTSVPSKIYGNPHHLAILAKMAARGQLDLIQLELPYVLPEAGLFKLLGVPLVLDQHGVEIDFLREIARSRGMRVGTVDFLTVAIVESLAVHLSSLVLCCSENDRQRLLGVYGGSREKYVVVENGVDERFFESVKPYPFRAPTVLYLGSLDHAPNKYAISWILQEILPRVRKAVPEVQFAFVGSARSTTPPELKEALVFRNVTDVRPYIRGAAVALSTVFQGSGSRLKTLEYLACGAPVVSTTKGVEGIDLELGRDILVADDAEQIARWVIELIGSPMKAREIGAHGREVVQERYTWSVIVDRCREAYDRLTA